MFSLNYPWIFGKIRSCSSYINYLLDLDGCSDNPCRFGGVCENGGLNCTCAHGFQGPTCSEGTFTYGK